MTTITRHFPEGKQEEQKKLSEVTYFSWGFLFPGVSIHAVYMGIEQMWIRARPLKKVATETKPESESDLATIVSLDGKSTCKRDGQRAVTPYPIYITVMDLGTTPVKLSSLKPGDVFRPTSKLDIIGKTTGDASWMIVETVPQKTGKVTVLSLNDAAILTEIDDDYLIKQQKMNLAIEDAQLVDVGK